MNKFLICALLALSFAGNSTVYASRLDQRLKTITSFAADSTIIDNDNYNRTFQQINKMYDSRLNKRPDLTNYTDAPPTTRDSLGMWTALGYKQEFKQFENKTWKDLIASRSADAPTAPSSEKNYTTEALKKIWTSN